MTSVLLTCGGNGCFKSCFADGHAGFAKRGKDIVCASETLLLRTAVDVLESVGGIGVTVDKSRRGSLSFSVSYDSDSCGVEVLERLKCTADFIRMGIQSLSEEFPDCVQLIEKIG